MISSLLQKLPLAVVGLLLVVSALIIYFRSKNVTKKEFFKLQDKNKISHSITTMSSNDKAIQKAIEYEKSKNNLLHNNLLILCE